ncbi:MAG: nucleotidyl transferase AbiEii/AbiGii toxin family protein, partial [Lachnospiraceae bacterium]|nr:nucleotidyl transferase AbiEii/AbiGii toxin family protein [Lachnospiraceae bacterium]
MINIFEKTNEMKEEGYSELNAQAKLCQDIVLDALSKSDLSRNVTIIEGINISITREIEELKQQ